MTTLGYALLGLLAREPLSGYDLAGRLKGRVSFFWAARHSQIYPELARLQAQGLVSYRVVEQQGRPDKKVYAITETGLTALHDWVTAPVDPGLARDELVLKAYSLWVADPLRAAALFREHERRHTERLADYEQRLAWLERKYGARLRQPGTHPFSTFIALQRGIGYEREYATWCGWVAAQVESGPGDEAVPPATSDETPID